MLEGVSQEHAAVCSLVLEVALANSTTVAAQVLTSQYDNLRTGVTLREKILTPQNVNANQFGKQGGYKVDGAVYAQPLFIPSVEIPGKGKHDVILVATEHDSVYALDAERPGDAPWWQVSLLDKKRGDEPVSARDVQCPFIQPEIGITSTPVIDLKTGTASIFSICTRWRSPRSGKVRRSQADYRIRPGKRRWFFRWASAF